MRTREAATVGGPRGARSEGSPARSRVDAREQPLRSVLFGSIATKARSLHVGKHRQSRGTRGRLRGGTRGDRGNRDQVTVESVAVPIVASRWPL